MNLAPTLTTSRPAVGEVIASYAYPKTIITDYASEKRSKISISESWHYGEIEAFYEEGTPFLKNPCFQSTMYIPGGSSGGPVTNTKGQIFAINSTGADVAEGIKPYSFLTPIELCLDIAIDGDDGKKYTIQQLINLDQILFEE